MLHVVKLYTGADKASHVAEGTVAENDRTDVVAIHFQGDAGVLLFRVSGASN
jgi:hypothetical protein